MYGLLMRLSALDADAASAVRVIGFFDALVEARAGIGVILRQTAMLAECPVGARTADGRVSDRIEPGGATARYGEPPAGARTYQLPSGGEGWLGAGGPPHPLDDLLIERFALAAGLALGPGRRQVEEMDQAALLRLAVSSAAAEPERLRAVDRLGLSPASTVHVTAVTGPPTALDEICCALSG